MNAASKGKILICDDQPSAEKKWENELKKVPGLIEHFEIEVMVPTVLLEAAMGLEQRRRAARTDGSGISDSDAQSAALEKIDAADVLVVDYDLLELAQQYYQTGEDIAYLARCYSGCQLVVGLNQFDHGSPAFDLRMTGYTQSFADLNIGDPALKNVGLWHPEWMQQGVKFRPWAWPLIPQAVDRYRRRVEELIDKLNEPILAYLGFPEEVVNAMPRTVLEFITSSTDDPMQTTFHMFATGGEMGSNEGLRRKDKAPSDRALARIAAARVAHWLEQVVLPGQHLLVDGPHLVSRYPSLLSGDGKDVDAWNATTALGNDIVGIKADVIQPFRFARTNWLSRPAWYWPLVNKCEEIQEVQDPWSAASPRFVFCEDTSTFALKAKVQEFVSDLGATSSPFIRRFAKKVKNVVYKPSVRFSM